ncbi:Glyoxylase, beta-lactamase superfamily II [Noviherbaspirillum humi]|uniref:Glyoxylase, beta-lactamase superfamily II n=1 Tax=Noviherbaspirillum humi TaxID=1688639 RepID=A0A239L766_9BURK|nr:MBL fold metallo-hydrolase [Noviherbaspirillum humi]SNT25703.1 Glyoxylase, beta-lactamase superfamily II [Noviherbaspirillum humi]
MNQPAGTPRPAATLIPVRDGPQGLEVFMMQRTHQAAFVPGGYVFPGGAVDNSDHDPAYAAHCPGFDDAAASAMLSLPAGGLAFFVAAIRECFEEAGLLLATGDDETLVEFGEADGEMVDSLRRRIAGGDIGFAALCAEHGWRLAFDRLAYLAHWTTPLGSPRRFDTRFFVAVAPPRQTGSHDDGETIAHCWIRPADALERQRSGEFSMMFATVATLRKLAAFETADALLQHARELTGISMILPRVCASRAGRKVLIPGDAAYAEIGRLDPEGRGDASCEILPGVATRLAPGLWRIAAPNPGFMTGPGTNSYLLDSGDGFAVIDPGPDDAGHVQALLDHAGSRIRWVLTTHTHLDHSPAAQRLRERTGAQLLGMPAPAAERQDQAYRPDQVLRDGEIVELGAARLQALHTPGHASNHLCYLMPSERLLFTGDHIMQGSTVVINPPDGDMRAYLASLAAIESLGIDWFAPGHGFLMAHPKQVIARIRAHRLQREAKVLDALRQHGEAEAETLLATVYDDVPAARHAMALRSLLAHLLKLEAEGHALRSERGGSWRSTGR